MFNTKPPLGAANLIQGERYDPTFLPMICSGAARLHSGILSCHCDPGVLLEETDNSNQFSPLFSSRCAEPGDRYVSVVRSVGDPH